MDELDAIDMEKIATAAANVSRVATNVMDILDCICIIEDIISGYEAKDYQDLMDIIKKYSSAQQKDKTSIKCEVLI